MKTTIRATSPAGRTMYHTADTTEWSPNLADARDYQCRESAQVIVDTRQPFKSLKADGFVVEVV